MPNAMPQHFFLVVGGCSCLCAKPKPWLHGTSLVLDLKTLSKNHLLVTWQNVAGSCARGGGLLWRLRDASSTDRDFCGQKYNMTHLSSDCRGKRVLNYACGSSSCSYQHCACNMGILRAK